MLVNLSTGFLLCCPVFVPHIAGIVVPPDTTSWSVTQFWSTESGAAVTKLMKSSLGKILFYIYKTEYLLFAFVCPSRLIFFGPFSFFKCMLFKLGYTYTIILIETCKPSPCFRQLLKQPQLIYHSNHYWSHYAFVGAPMLVYNPIKKPMLAILN